MPDVQMPRLSDSMETGKIIRWIRQEGEEVKKGEPLVEIESDKANIEVEAYASGRLSKIVVPEGESAPIGAVIAQIGGEATRRGAELAKEERAPQPRAAQPEEHVAQAQAAATAAAAGPQRGAEAGSGEQYPQGGVDDRTEAGAAAQAALQSLRRKAPADADGDRIKASPVARRLAEEMGVDLRRVEGTGPGGRITREDVEAARPAGTKPAERETTAPAQAAPASGAGRTATPRPTEPVEVVELSRMQATVAVRLAQSKFSAPHFYVTSEIAMDDAVRFRREFNESVPPEEAISFNDLIVKAVGPTAGSSANGRSISGSR
ncbi:MAG: hypothetical protein E6J00_10990 [Chloroflexi bacterium]|nr:MAG: hypothetical protein E6J00_10990 [Chloroflexota bacterium]